MKVKIDFDKVKDQSKEFLDNTSDVLKQTGTKVVKKTKETFDDLKTYVMKPVFEDYLTRPDYKVPQLIRVVEDDGRRKDPLFKDSIGYFEYKRNMPILNIFQDCIGRFGYNFYPSLVIDQLYYFEPNRTNSFVRLTEFFTEMQKSKFNELEQIAYKLGAKHYIISISEEAYKMTSKKSKAGASEKKRGGPKAEFDSGDKEETDVKITIGAEKRFTGSSSPVRPELVWFKNDQQLLSLIEMRCSGESQRALDYNKLVFDCKSTSVITMDLGIKLDGVIKDYGFKTNFSVKSAVEEEYRKKLIYCIEF